MATEMKHSSGPNIKEMKNTKEIALRLGMTVDQLFDMNIEEFVICVLKHGYALKFCRDDVEVKGVMTFTLKEEYLK
jgi:hypothetical protein